MKYLPAYHVRVRPRSFYATGRGHRPWYVRPDPDTAYACQCDVCPCREPATREGRVGPAICDACQEAHA